MGDGRVAVGQVEQLVERTEGWAAGLQLATITMGDPACGVRVQDVVGSLRTFTDYLITEVVDQQPARMRDFLYATALVDRVNPALARVLSGAPDAGQMLRQAEQQGLFVTALDGRDEWYRYHHLFAEALRHELRVRSPEAADAIHGRAAAWFEARGEAASVLEHWLAAGRPEEALRLVIDVGFALSDRGQAQHRRTHRPPDPADGARRRSRPPARLRHALLPLRAGVVPRLGRSGHADLGRPRRPRPRPRDPVPHGTVAGRPLPR